MSALASVATDGLLVLREAPHRCNRALDTPSSVVWLSDGSEPIGPEPLAQALGAEPAASFAVAVERASQVRDLAAVLSGTALGCAVLVRASALATIGGVDEVAPNAAAAQWDLAVRLAEAGHEWIDVQAASTGAAALTDRAGPEAARWMYRRHRRLYARHLREVLRDRERLLARLRSEVALEERALEDLTGALEAARRERDRLTAKLRGARPRGDLWRLEPFADLGGTPIERYYVERFLERHAGDREPILLIDVLHAARDPVAVLRRCREELQPGGVLLASVPVVAGFSAAGFRELLESVFDPADVEIRSHGNRVVLAGSLLGAPAQALGGAALDALDPATPVVLTARVVG